MTSVSGASADALFSSTGYQQSGFANLSTTALSRGIDAYMNSDFDKAVREFRRSIGLAPYSENSLKAYDFMAQAYLKQDKLIEAESTYKEATRLFPNNDAMHTKLGNLYFSQTRYGEAETEYRAAVRINPSSTENLYSMGQLYLATNRYSEAEKEFKKILTLTPDAYAAYYSLGQVYNSQGRHEETIDFYKRAIELKKDFAYAYLDLGHVYVELGMIDEAQEQVRILDDISSALAGELRDHIYETRRPKFFFATTDAFDFNQGPGTPLSSLDPDLTPIFRTT